MHEVEPHLYTTVILTTLMLAALCLVWARWQSKDEEEQPL
jgi:hypothetical protein